MILYKGKFKKIIRVQGDVQNKIKYMTLGGADLFFELFCLKNLKTYKKVKFKKF